MRIASIGTGFITDVVMGQMLEYEENHYEAIYSRKEETARKLQEKYQVQKVYTDLEEMLKDQDIDAVYIASPNSLHATQAIQVMRAGKTAIVEKPFASNAKEVEEMIRVSQETGQYLFEALTVVNVPHFPIIQKELNKIGPIHLVECNFSKYSSKFDAYLRGENPNVFTTEFSGGALMDLNIYNLHYTVGLFGMPSEVKYHAHLEENGVDSSGTLILTYPHFIASLSASKNSTAKIFAQIQGQNGLIYVDGPASRLRKIEVICGKESYEIDEHQRDTSHYFYVGEILRIMREKDHVRYHELLEHSLNVMKVVDQAKKSAGIVFAADR